MRYLIALLLLTAVPGYAEDIGNNTVCFVPGPDDCAMVAVAEIEKAQRTIDMQSYQLTEPHVAQALLDAKARGVSIRLIVDKTAPHEKNGETMDLVNAGVPTWVDYKPRIAHNKVIVIDGAEVLGGSWNQTVNATIHNAENLTVIRDPQWAAAYERNLESRLAVSEPLDQYEAEHQR